MRQFITTVLERRRDFTSDFQTEPYETAWASEAVFFIRVEEVSGKSAALTAAAQISVDGIHWIDEGTAFPAITAAGNYFVRVSHFGGWLRLNCNVGGEDARFKLTIHLVLKE